MPTIISQRCFSRSIVANFTTALALLIVASGCGGSGAPTEGDKSIYAAAEDGDMSIISTYIGRGFDVNEPDASGKTLLHHAAQANQIEVMEMLIEEYRAKTDVTDNDGKTPTELAQDAGAMDAVDYMQEES